MQCNVADIDQKRLHHQQRHPADERDAVQVNDCGKDVRYAFDVAVDGRQRKAFGKLYVLGAPAFLGMLRKHQSAGLRNLISDEIAKDLTTQTPERIRAQLPEYL
mgnify:CR=1 FL=1